MNSDYVDNWDALPPVVQDALEPIIERFDAGADLLFDRRRNLSFEAAVTELSVPGVVALTEGLRLLRDLLAVRITIVDPAQGSLLFDGILPLTAYDLPLYTPCVYLSQLAQYLDTENVRVWKAETAEEIVAILLLMARYVRPDIEIARVTIAALHDMVYLYPDAKSLLQGELASSNPNSPHIATVALHLLERR